MRSRRPASPLCTTTSSRCANRSTTITPTSRSTPRACRHLRRSTTSAAFRKIRSRARQTGRKCGTRPIPPIRMRCRPIPRRPRTPPLPASTTYTAKPPVMDSMEPRTRPGRSSESGFTLAGVIVIMTIMMIVVAYTVPRMWSTVMKRERERQTIFIMQQHAKAIADFRLKNNAYPTTPQQLKDARQPRMIRGIKGEYVDPLTGEVDWLVIPQAAGASLPVHGGTGINGGVGPVIQPSTPPPDTTGSNADGLNPAAPPGLPGIPIKDYAGGPFIGVRPAAHGKSMTTLFGADTYETWLYTTLDYDQEVKLRVTAASISYH